MKQTIVPILSLLTITRASSRPNIIVILADDLGWNDVSYHGSDQIPTPNIDALAYNGIILNSHYVPALCTPSRASLLTGKYPTSLGMQHMVILAQEPWGLPLEEQLLPEHLRRHGYATHAIGKWHLGFHKKSYTPLKRGFDSFLGYYNGYQDYYDHTVDASDQEVPQRGYDMRRNLDIDYESLGKYSTDYFTDEAVEIIEKHDAQQGPLFLYLAHLAPHTGNNDKPYQAPDEEITKFSYIKDPERRVYAAMVSRLDQSVGKVITALRSTGKLDNSIVLFMSDNGAVTFGVHSNHGSNYPLRGLKESPWEGGVRGVAALWSPLLNRTRRISNQLMHGCDWMPTLFSAAGLDTSELGEIDGMDMWASLSHDLQSPRTEIFNNYDEIENYASLRVGPWKYVSGTAQDGEVDDWYGDSGEEDSPPAYDISQILKSETSIALTGLITEQQLQAYPNAGPQLLTPDEMMRLRNSGKVKCSVNRKGPLAFQHPNWQTRSNITANSSYAFEHGQIVEEIAGKLLRILGNSGQPQLSHLDDFACDPRKTVCLFHLEQDPCEELNLANFFPTVVRTLETRLKFLKGFVRKPLNQPGDPLSNPALHNGTWSHWCDAENESFTADDTIFNEKLARLILDNILVKILTVPLLSAFAIVFRTIWSVIQTFISLVTLIVILVLTMFLANHVKIQKPKKLTHFS